MSKNVGGAQFQFKPLSSSANRNKFSQDEKKRTGSAITSQKSIDSKFINKNQGIIFKQDSKKREMLQSQVRAIISDSTPHDKNWWLDSKRKEILKKVFMENSDDSEDETGRKIYIKERD